MHAAPTRSEIEHCYRILELEPDASSDHVERSWRKLVDEWSPDRFEADPVLHERAHSRVHVLNHAREVLRRSGVEPGSAELSASPSNRDVQASRSSWRRRPLVVSTLFAGVAVVAVLIARPLTAGRTKVMHTAPAPAREKPAPIAPPQEHEPKMILMARGPLTVSVSLVADGRILLPATSLQAGQTASVPRVGPTYVKYSAGENLEIQIDGRRYPMPDAGSSRAKIH